MNQPLTPAQLRDAERRGTFIWRSGNGNAYTLGRIDDAYLVNIRSYLQRERQPLLGLNPDRRLALMRVNREISKRGLWYGPIKFDPQWHPYLSEDYNK